MKKLILVFTWVLFILPVIKVTAQGNSGGALSSSESATFATQVLNYKFKFNPKRFNRAIYYIVKPYNAPSAVTTTTNGILIANGTQPSTAASITDNTINVAPPLTVNGNQINTLLLYPAGATVQTIYLPLLAQTTPGTQATGNGVAPTGTGYLFERNMTDKMLGNILKQSGDTFYVQLKDSIYTNKIILIASPGYPHWIKYSDFNVSVINLPFALSAYRYNFKHTAQSFSQSSVSTNFLNVDVSFMYQSGAELFYTNKNRNPKSFAWGFGPIAGLSSESISQNNISYGDSMSIKKYMGTTIPVVRLGGGIFVSVYSVNLVFATGCEYGLGGDGNAWRFDKQLWVGIGIAFNFPTL